MTTAINQHWRNKNARQKSHAPEPAHGGLSSALK
jgi:hypothetical protein